MEYWNSQITNRILILLIVIVSFAVQLASAQSVNSVVLAEHTR